MGEYLDVWYGGAVNGVEQWGLGAFDGAVFAAIVDAANRQQVVAALVRRLEENDFGTTCGNVGFRFLIRALADEAGDPSDREPIHRLGLIPKPIVVKDGQVHIQAGGGIVADSDAIDRTEWLGLVYAQAGLGLPLLDGLIVVEPYICAIFDPGLRVES